MYTEQLPSQILQTQSTRGVRCLDYAAYLASERSDHSCAAALKRLRRVFISTRVRWAFVLSLAIGALIAWAPELSFAAQMTLLTFALAIIGWTVLDLDETPVAIAAAIALVAFGATTPDTFYNALGDELIWLMIGGFVLAAAITQSGLAERFGKRLIGGAQTVDQLLMRVAMFIVATAFVIPSTSARAALLLPVFLGLVAAIGQPRISRALALLFPTIILLSACASLLGAGAHLVAIDFMARVSGDAPGYIEWIALAAPFAIVSSYLGMKGVAWLFLNRDERGSPLSLSSNPAAETPMTQSQRNLVCIASLTLVAWALTDVHGIDAAIVAMIGALAATTKSLTGIDIKTAIKKVEWNLVLFLAATMVLGEALQHTGAANSIAQAVLTWVPLGDLSNAALLTLCATIALLSHLLITSRTVRATVLIPTIALPLAAHGVDASLLILVAVIGSGFCQTFTVSAKPIAVFSHTEAASLSPRDLAMLSAALFLPLLALLALFATVYWPMLGL